MLQSLNKYLGNASAWLVIGMSGILAVVVIGLAVMNYNRESQYMAQILSEKGASLIRAFEAGVRTGMMGEFGTLARMDTLIKEMASQDDILYIAIVDSSGVILAHSDSTSVGQYFLDSEGVKGLKASKDVKWRTVDTDVSEQSFEVYKLFLPVLPVPSKSQMMRQHMKMMQTQMGSWCEPGWMEGLPQDKLLHPDNRPVIIIGMASSSFEEAINEDIKLTVVISGVLLLLGIAGVVSLFWAQSYTRSNILLNNISAISSEMINNLPEGVILTDNDLKIHYMNQIAATMLGNTAEKAIGLNAEDILPSNINSIKVSPAQDDKVVEHEIRLRRQYGKTIPLSVIAMEVLTKDGTFVGHMYLLKDLSQIKQLQLEIQRKEKLAVIGNLAAGVAHEVRNPLSSIKGYASHFKNLFAEDSENRAAAEILISETERLNRVITELLEISRPSDIKPQKIAIESIFDTSRRLIQPDTSQHTNVKFDLNISPDIREIFVDPDRFVQVLVNIYLNSLQSMPGGGHLKTEVFSVNDRVAIVIKDTGTGMSEETKNQIFNPYFTTKSKGIGLGMAIVQKIVEAHSGEITVASEDGKGTVITIDIPKN